VVVLTAAFLCVVVSIALAAQSTLPMTLTFTVDGSVAPRKLPAHEFFPIELGVRGTIADSDGLQPPNLREVVADFDRDVSLDADGLPACGASQIRFRRTKAARRVCRESIVGTGVAHLGVEASGQTPLVAPVQLTFFNGGERDGTTTLLIHGSDPALELSPVVARVKIHSSGSSQGGRHAVARFPSIAEGSGTVLDFRFEINRRFWHQGAKRSYLTAKCPEGHLSASLPKVSFRNEVPVGGRAPVSVLKGTLILPCTPKG
jgi:hypothetical protein